MLFPWRPVENFLVPHAACPRAVMCQSFRKRACLIFGTRTIVTKNNNRGPIRSSNWNEKNLNPLSRIHWRASLVNAREFHIFAAHSPQQKKNHARCRRLGLRQDGLLTIRATGMGSASAKQLRRLWRHVCESLQLERYQLYVFHALRVSFLRDPVMDDSHRAR